MTMLAERVIDRVGVAEAFRFAPGVRDVLPRFRGRCTVVRLSTLDNEVLRVPRWYTLDEAWCETGSALASAWRRNPVVSVGPSDSPELVLATATPVIVLGADNAGNAWARSVVDAIRAACRHVLVVDLGMHPDTAYADIATFGSDRSRGGALLSVLTDAA
jgi:hypothetical protein